MGQITDVCLNQKEIHQVILNLSRNGLEAMRPGGVLTIKTCQENDKVLLAVQDEGCGIPEEILDRIGTPFLTSKDHGTGLGLTISYNIVKRHNAEMKVDTGPHGTTFEISFKFE